MFKLPEFFNKSHSPKTSQFLTLDIGTDYVKCLVFEHDPESFDSKLKVIGASRQPLGYLYTRGGAIVDLEGVKEASQQAVTEALNLANSKTKDVIIGLSGETTKGLVTTVRLTRPEPETAISHKELSSIISRIQETAYIEASKEIAEMTGNPDLDIDITNSSVISFKVDDTYVTDPKGLSCKRMEVGLFTAFSPSIYLNVLQSLAKALKLNLLTISSEMYALSRLLAKSHEDANMVIIDVGGETTDVGIVFGGGLVATKTLSIGGRHFTRAISEAYSLPINEAEEIKVKYSLNTYSDSDSLKIRQCMREVLSFWISGIELVMSDFEGVKTFPSRIVLTGGGIGLRDIPETLETTSWARNVAFRNPPVFEKVNLTDLKIIKDLTGQALSFEDIMPASLGSIYLEMIGQN